MRTKLKQFLVTYIDNKVACDTRNTPKKFIIYVLHLNVWNEDRFLLDLFPLILTVKTPPQNDWFGTIFSIII
jgi:hypothetical protein